MAKQKELMPSADLLPRDGDVDLTPEQMGKLSLFAGLKGKTDLEKFPGTLRVRHYRTGDAICRQGEAGWTAFYILTAADVLMPSIDTCKQCHNRTTAGVRSDCLECHQYHDRSAEPRGLHGRMTVEQALEMARPK